MRRFVVIGIARRAAASKLMTILPVILICIVVPELQAKAEPPIPRPAPGAPAIGATIDSANAEQFSRYITEPLMDALRHGLKLKVLSTSHLDWNSRFQRATEQYSGQVKLDETNGLAGYVAGLPFPLIDLTDPKAATKIAYNWSLGPFNRDDNEISNYAEAGFAFELGNPGPTRRSPDLDHTAERISFLRYARRTQVAPIPEIPDNHGVEWKLRVSGWRDFSHTDCAPMFDPYVDPYSSITIRHLDRSRPDDTYMMFEGSRRLERYGYEAFPDMPSHLCWYPYWQPRTEFYTFRLLGDQPMLASVNAAGANPGLSEDSQHLGELPVELRSIYILEMAPVEPRYSSKQRAIIYIDSEAYLEVGLIASGLADEGAGVSEVELPVWRKVSRPEGTVYEVAGLFYQGEVNPPPSLPTTLRDQVRKDWNTSFWWAGPGDQTFNSGSVSESSFSPQMLQTGR